VGRDAALAEDAATPDAPSADVGTASDAGVGLDVSAADASPTDARMPPEPDAGGEGDLDVELVVTVPADTPDDPPVHVAGDFQGWDPADARHALTRRTDGTWAITLRLARGRSLAFKFARGGWNRVEKGAQGEEIQDRRLTVTQPGIQRFTVLAWADQPATPSTVVGDVREIQVPGFLGGRRVWVYLPPGYAASATRYPVLYMFDGQNVFDARTSFSGEWRVDEALEAGIPAGRVAPIIVVAVDNGGASRVDEYTPWVGTLSGQPGGGGGGEHLRQLAEILKPWVDQTYRTQPGPESTGLAGSSLGGLMGVYAAYARPDVFGRVAALSPSVWWAGERLVEFVTQQPKPAARLWTDMGTAEGSIGPFRRLRAALVADGFVEGDDLRTVEVAGAGHNEAAWSARIPDVLAYLFPPP
jgi:pullulanase